MRRDGPRVEAGGEAAVAVGGDATGPIVTNLNVYISPELDDNDTPSADTRSRILPPNVPDFTGRESEIDTIESEATQRRECSRSMVAVLSGKPGVGKTSLAVHIAHRIGDSYGDGELYADLRGVDEQPADPFEIMGRFLVALGLPEGEVPVDSRTRLDFYRQTISGRALVIILDNAADEKQVRPLLPPGDEVLVIVTSRNKMAGLESVYRFDLEIFPQSTSLDFIRKVVGFEMVGRELAEAQAVADFCGHLPLALRIAANRLNVTRSVKISDLARELRDERDRLEALAAGDLAVRTAFNLSYRKLGKGCRNAFRSLSLVPGADFGPGICSALTGADERQSARTLRRLAEANLIEPSETAGRFRFHDLLKIFASEKTQKDSPDRIFADRDRMLAWLRNSARRAQIHLGGISHVHIPGGSGASLESIEDAVRWVEQEFSNAVSALSISESYGSPMDTAIFAAALSGICDTSGRWSDWEKVNSIGLRSARRIGSQQLESVLLGQQANLFRYRREFQDALSLAEQVYAQSRATERPLAIARAANQLGCVKMDLGLHDEALPLLRESLEIYERLDVKHEVTKVLYNLGTIHQRAGEMDAAIDYFERDLSFCLDAGDESGAADTLNTLALAYIEMGDFAKAEKLQLRSLEMFSKIGNPYHVSMICNDLAITLRRRGRNEEALDLLLKDVEICRKNANLSGEALAHSNAAEVLHALGRNVEAAERATIAQSTFEKLCDDQRLALSVISHIPILFEAGKVDKAIEGADRAIGILKRFGRVKEVAGAHQILAREYGEIGDWGKVVQHARRALEIGESLLAPYLHAATCVMALDALAKLGGGQESAQFESVLRELLAANPEIRDRLPIKYCV